MSTTLISTSLSATQQEALALISAGSSIAAAAARVGVHRNTISNWLHNTEFRAAFETARKVKQLLYWDEVEALAAKAITSLTLLMDDPLASASVRLKATLALLQHATSFQPGDIPSLVLPETPASETSAPVPVPQKPETMHKLAQLKLEPPAPPAPAAVPTIRHSSPKIGRNDLCPCGSGAKFKRCCLAKGQTLAAASMAA